MICNYLFENCITASGSFSSTPSCNTLKKEKKNHQTNQLGNFGRAQINQIGNFGRALINPPRQLWARPYQSARQFWARPYQSVRQQTTTSTLHLDFPSPPHIAWGSLLLFVYTADPLSPSDQGQQRPTYPSSPFEHVILGCCLVASIWPFGDNTGGQTEVKIKQVVTSVHETTRLWRKLHPNVQLFQRRKGACCTGLPAGLPIKENLGDTRLQSTASDGHCHTSRGHNLNYTIWTLYAESVS